MNETRDRIEVQLDALEERVTRAAELVKQLKEDKLRLVRENGELRDKLLDLDGHSQQRFQAMESHLVLLEKEKTQWLEEKRAMARRVEEALTKLEFLESESVPH